MSKLLQIEGALRRVDSAGFQRLGEGLSVSSGVTGIPPDRSGAGRLRLLGTFAMYYAEPRAPTDSDLALIEGAAHLVLVAIEAERTQAGPLSSLLA